MSSSSRLRSSSSPTLNIPLYGKKDFAQSDFFEVFRVFRENDRLVTPYCPETRSTHFLGDSTRSHHPPTAVDCPGYLQNKGYLLGEVEELELEDLQGVKGLRALRVEVNVELRSDEKHQEDLIKEIKELTEISKN